MTVRLLLSDTMLSFDEKIIKKLNTLKNEMNVYIYFFLYKSLKSYLMITVQFLNTLTIV